MALDTPQDDCWRAMEKTGADFVIFFQQMESIGHIMADHAQTPFLTVERPIHDRPRSSNS